MSERPFDFESDLRCKPLKSLKDIEAFVYDPPVWRTLCQPPTPHSRYVVINSEVNPTQFDLENPLAFCHFNPEVDVPKRHEEAKVPKLLVCHDMANGYHDDSIIDGTSKYDAYTFYNWAAVDIFCYFSHHLVTIPPLGWINVAHAHGVKVIGTFITEWADGESFWDDILDDEVKTQNLISSLVTIAKTLKFEGWLLNVENKINKPKKLLQFVDDLHKTLHQMVPHAELIWYDSVTTTGQLSWQNRLNDLNRPFFDACDGIFTNYSWKPSDIAESAKEAGHRIRDVYIGIDVWGRNFYGGGMFNTQEAVKVVHKHKCSTAVFAPAWTREDLSEQCNPIAALLDESLSTYKRFLIRDRALWGSLWPYFKTKLPNALPFKTSFCRGHGKKRRMWGEVFSNGPWYNLRHMQYQPNSAHGPHGYQLSMDHKNDVVNRVAIREKTCLLKPLLLTQKEMNDEKKINFEDTKMSDKETNTNDEDKKLSEDVKKMSVEDKNMSNKDTNTIDEDKNISEENKKMNDKVTQKSNQEHVENILVSNEDSANESNTFKNLFGQNKKEKKEENFGSQTNPENNKEISTIKEPLELKQNSSQEKSTGVISADQSAIVTPVKDILRHTVAYVRNERECLMTYLDDSFNGGSCLNINPSDNFSEEHRTIRLFQSDFLVEDTLVICMVTKVVREYLNQWLNMWLYVMTDRGIERRVELVGRWRKDREEPSSMYERQYPLDPASEEFRDLQTYLVVYEPGFYVPVENSYGWQIFYYQVSLQNTRVTSINLRTNDINGPILLGHLGLCERNPKLQIRSTRTT